MEIKEIDQAIEKNKQADKRFKKMCPNVKYRGESAAMVERLEMLKQYKENFEQIKNAHPLDKVQAIDGLTMLGKRFSLSHSYGVWMMECYRLAKELENNNER